MFSKSLASFPLVDSGGHEVSLPDGNKLHMADDAWMNFGCKTKGSQRQRGWQFTGADIFSLRISGGGRIFSDVGRTLKHKNKNQKTMVVHTNTFS